MCRKIARGLHAYRLVDQWEHFSDGIKHRVYAQDSDGILHFICMQGSYGNTWQGYHNAELHHDYADVSQALRAQGYVEY